MLDLMMPGLDGFAIMNLLHDYAAGKTQFIRNASEIAPLETEAPVTHAAKRAIKSRTTVGLDFGILLIDLRHKLFLFGTPGQERFDFL